MQVLCTFVSFVDEACQFKNIEIILKPLSCALLLFQEPPADKKEDEKKADAKKQKVKVIDLPVVAYVPRLTNEEINLLTELEVWPGVIEQTSFV